MLFYRPLFKHKKHFLNYFLGAKIEEQTELSKILIFFVN